MKIAITGHTKGIGKCIFDNIISDGWGYCSPFIERSSSNDNLETSTSKNEYSNISLFNLIKFDYIDTNINNNCNP